MVRPASFDKNGMKRGAWSEEEDNKLRACIRRFGHPNWRLLPLVAGLKRCGKSCRLRWVNYLKPGLRRGKFTKDEKHLIIELHKQLGNKWAAIAAHFPGRTDNDIKNYWHAHIHKRRNRNGLTRAMRIQNLDQEEQSNSDNNNNYSTITTTTGPNPAENTGVFESNADSVFNAPCFTNFEIDRENFAEQESIMSPLCDWGISPWNYLAAAAKPEPDFSTYYSVEEDLFNVNFGDNYYEYVQISEHIYP